MLVVATMIVLFNSYSAGSVYYGIYQDERCGLECDNTLANVIIHKHMHNSCCNSQ